MKAAIVTGATRGIGKAISVKLLKLGYHVVGTYLSNKRLALDLEKEHSNLLMIQSDAGNEKGVKKVINAMLKRYGTIDVIVNNAGINLFGKIEKYNSSDWDKIIDSSLKSIFLFSKYSIPHLKKSENPVIINISSRLGFQEYTEPEFVAYGAVKAGVNNFTVGLAKELEKDKIRVNAIIPTPTKTDLFDKLFNKEDEEELKKKGKLGKPEEVADLVARIIQDKKINGEILIDKRVYL